MRHNHFEPDLCRTPAGRVNLDSCVFCPATSQVLRLPIAISVCLWQWDKPLTAFVISIFHTFSSSNSPCHFNFSHISQSLSISLALALALAFALSLFLCVWSLCEWELLSAPSCHRPLSCKKTQLQNCQTKWTWSKSQRSQLATIRPGDPTLAMPDCYSSSGKPKVRRHFASTFAATLTGTPSIKRMFPEACCVRADY